MKQLQAEPAIVDYHQFIEGLPAAIYTCDTQGRITFYNESAAALWGRNPEIGKDLWCGSWKIYHPDGTPMELDTCPMAITLKEGKPVKGKEIIIIRPDGKRRYVLPHPQPIFDSTGTLIGAVNMLVDITEKRERDLLLHESEKKYRELADSLEKTMEQRTSMLLRRNEELKKSEERYHKMIEEVRDYAILLLDKDGTILNWNRGAEKIKGYTEKEITGKNFRVFYLPDDRKGKLPEKLIDEAARLGKATNEGFRLRKDGTTFWGSITITALHDDQNNIIGFSKVTRDLTEKKLADDKLKQYAAELEIQNKELAQYAYIASHDLQEPLRKIQTFVSLLENSMDDMGAVKKYLEKIQASARRMSTLIKDVLNYSRVSDGEREFVETDLNEVMKNIEQDFELMIHEKKAVINYAGLPVIKGVPVQLYQLFSNLVSNSLKFNEDQPVIDISAVAIKNGQLKDFPQLNPEKAYIKLTFQDNGIGFAPQYESQVFSLFKRLNDSKKYTGTGLGLALCKKIAENHEGTISAESELDKGTTVSVFLPVG